VRCLVVSIVVMDFLISIWAEGHSVRKTPSILGEKDLSLLERIEFESVRVAIRSGKRTTKMTRIPTTNTFTFTSTLYRNTVDLRLRFLMS
tara:strand:+ start:283 stop:552 length:270 start_codon:yes stop_codon:yes gene_type:complete